MKGFRLSVGTLTLALALSGCSAGPPVQETGAVASATPRALPGVSAMARLEPSGEIHAVAPPVGRAAEPVKSWLVKEGDQVKKGQLIAVMDSESLLRAELVGAEAEVERALAAKAQVEAGPKQGEIRRQQAEIDRLEREWSIGLQEKESSIRRARAAEDAATREWQRYRSLLKDGAVSQSVYDQKELEYTVRRREREELEQSKQKLDAGLQAGLQSARAELERIAEVRPTDVRMADAEIQMARSRVQRVQSDLEKTRVYSPIDGTVLEILAKEGEVPKEGLAEIGLTDRMVAIAEVHQQDAGRVRTGMVAEVRSPALKRPIRGRVQRLGQQVERQRIFSNVPGENFDQRVVEVEIALEMRDVPEIRRLSNLQAEAIIEVGSP